MSLRLRVTGPAAIYVAAPIPGFAASGSIPAGPPTRGPSQLLGYCQRAPVIEINPHYRPVYADIAGRQQPIDKMDQGEDALIRCDLTYYDYAVYATIAGHGGGMYGKISKDDIGTLIMLQGKTLSLSIKGTSPLPYTFDACVLEHHVLSEMGTMASVLGLVFYAFMQHNADGSFQLYH